MKLCSLRLGLVTAAAVGSLLAFTSVSSAQNTNATNRAGRRGPTVEQRVDRLATELKLNDEQKTKVTALFRNEAKDRREIFSDRNLSRDERRDKMRSLAEEQNKELKVILTSEQFEKWKTLRAQMRANRPRRPNQGSQAEPAPAPAPTPTPNAGGNQAQ